MSQIPIDDDALLNEASQRFTQHAPSVGWEQIVVTQSPPLAVWAWFKPPHLPGGVVFKLTPDVWHANAARVPLTLRQLVNAIGVEPAAIVSWFLYGVPYDALAGNSPYFDQPIPPPPAGVEPDLSVVIASAVRFGGEPFQPSSQQAEAPDQAHIFNAIAADWDATLKLERQMVETRKNLVAMTNRLTALNRDLTPEENAAADRLDKSDWQDARRWLRDGASQLSRCIKQHDVGDTSAAGKRDWFQQIYDQSIRPRKPFDGMPDAHREFEMYRKRCQSLLTAMLTTISDAKSESERRATTVLSRIAAKVRDAKAKRNRGA